MYPINSSFLPLCSAIKFIPSIRRRMNFFDNQIRFRDGRLELIQKLEKRNKKKIYDSGGLSMLQNPDIPSFFYLSKIKPESKMLFQNKIGTRISEIVKKGNLDRGLQIFEAAIPKGEIKNTTWFTMILKLLLDPQIRSSSLILKEERLAKAFEVLQAQEKFEDAQDCKETSSRSYALLIRGLIEFDAPNKISHSERLIERIKSRNLKIRARTLEPLLKVACEGGNVKVAFDMWKLMKEEADDIYTHEKQHLHLLGLCASKCPERTVEILQHMRERFFPGESAYFMERAEGENQLEAYSQIFNSKEGGIKGHIVKLGPDNFCPACKSSPERMGLTLTEKKVLRTTLLKILASKSAWLSLKLAKFANFLDAKGSKNVSAVIDGANVAFTGSHMKGRRAFKPSQVDMLCANLERDGKKVLIILSEGYTVKRINNVGGASIRIGEAELNLFKRWEKEGKLYVTPKGANDDWFWIYAGVAFDHCNPVVYTNDEMRDHHYLLPTREFSKFKETQMVRIEIHDQDPSKAVEIKLKNPKPISQQIHEFRPGKWHIPNILQPDKQEWFCVDLEPFLENKGK